MFNPFNNPMVIRTVLGKAQEELNESLKFRKKQFANQKLYMWVEIDQDFKTPFVCLRNELDENLIRMTAEQLLEDKDIKEQLKKIPAIVRPFINFKKIVPEMNQRLLSELANDKFLKITEGASKAKIDLWNRSGIVQENIDLYQIFG